MFSIFRIILILSITGTVTALLLIILKPFTSKHFSAKWQYYIWIIALCALAFPLPVKTHKSQPLLTPPAFLMPAAYDGAVSINEENNAEADNKKKPDIKDALSLAWAFGFVIYLASALISYRRFILKKNRLSRRTDIDISKTAWKIGVKKLPEVRICADNSSPMLIGVVRPVIYLPDRNLKECMEQVLLHELMHYKRRDLLYKWIALIINAIHWFNPIVYIVTANINEFCEISCDIAVTENMSADEKKKYMRTILDLTH